MSISRNAPCPCGSGLKYKRCCLKKEQLHSPSRPGISITIDEANKLLLAHARRIHDDRIFQVYEKYIGANGGPFQQSPYLQLFIPWFLYFWTVEEEAGFAWSIEDTVAARFLKEKRSRASRSEREVIERGRREPFTFWEVTEVRPDVGIQMKDFVTGREVFAQEVLATRGLTRWDILFGRVVELGEDCVIDGMGPIILPPHRFRKEVESIGEELRSSEEDETKGLPGAQADALRVYMEMALRTTQAPAPRLQNMDGDKLVFVESTFVFDLAARSEVLMVLDGMRNIHPCGEEEGETAYVWEVSRKGNPLGSISKGRIFLTDTRLSLECNSRARDRQLRKRIDKDLGHLVQYVETTYKDIDLDALDVNDPDEQTEDFDLDLRTLPKEAREEIEGMMESVHLGWADQNVPVLDNRTPRELVKTTDGRRRVAAMINDFENREARRPDSQFRFDYNRLREELDLPATQIAAHHTRERLNEADLMDIETLRATPSWEWPENVDAILLGCLQDSSAVESTRILAAEMAGDPVAINDRLVNALLSIVADDSEPVKLRGAAAIALGPVLELGDMEGLDDYSDVKVSEEASLAIQEKLRQFYQVGEMPKKVRRRILEASVRAPQSWHEGAVRAAFYSNAEDWKLTAVFCMQYIAGFDTEILQALDSYNPDIRYHAVCAAGNREVDAAFSHVASIVLSGEPNKALLLAAIDAVAYIRPHQASDVLGELLEFRDEDIVEAVHEALAMAEGDWEFEDDDEFG